VWHSAYSLTPTISVAFDQLNAKNFPGFMEDVWYFKNQESSKVKALAAYVYAMGAGAMCKIKDGLSTTK
jgi:histone arginine demethylase JMJD6